jgi:putative ABC transport system substrate-binding protein
LAFSVPVDRVEDFEQFALNIVQHGVSDLRAHFHGGEEVANADNLAQAGGDGLEAAARTLGLQLHLVKASTESDIETALVTLAELRASGLVIPSDVFLITHEERLAAWALRHRMPAVFQPRSAAMAGGLMSYSGNALDVYRQAGVYTGRILKGEKPADLPVHQATKLELVINLKTANALGLTVPLPLLGRADE